jgi:crossover junction endodeoxyribonuclease RusA
VCVEITPFYEGAAGDVDNIIKPILDAIKGLVFADDSLVTDVVCRRRPLAGPFLVDRVSSVLADGLAGNREFLHVRVAASPAGGELRFL